AATLAAALSAGERVAPSQVGIFADGVAVRQVGAETFRLCREVLDDVVIVSTDEICAGIKDIFDDTRAVAEPAGAVSIAGLKKYAARAKREGASLIAINGGANLNCDRLRHIADRPDVRRQPEALTAVAGREPQ